jgi:hypothetical protein
MRLRQVVLVARQLAPVRDQFFAVLGLSADFQDPAVAKFGLENSVMTLGDTFLEVVSPIANDTTAGRFLKRRGGDGGYMVIVQIDDLAEMRARIDRLGVRVAWEAKADQAAAIHLHPKDVGGAILSFDQMWPPESWHWAGPSWEKRRARNVIAIDAVEVQSPDPAAMAARWSEIFQRPITGNTLRLDRGWIRFAPDEDGRGPGVSAVELLVGREDAALAAARQCGLPVQSDEFRLCGTNFRLVPKVFTMP